MKKIKTVKITSECIGCGTCETVCPDVFQVNSVSEVKQDVNLQDHKDLIQEAAEMCPVSAIKVALDDEE